MNNFNSTDCDENEFRENTQKWSLRKKTQFNVIQGVIKNSKILLRKLSKTIPGHVKSTARNILKVNEFHSYKMKCIHALLSKYFEFSFPFCAWFQGKLV